MKLFFSCFLLFFSMLSNGQMASKENFSFSELTFHSSRCNGPCPDISFQINSEKQVQLIRTVFKGKGVVDTIKSGSFRGTLDENLYDKLVTMLSKIKWDEITFPDVKCCDKPVSTLIIYYNGENKKLKSMEPAESAKGLIDFLVKLSLEVKLPKYDRPMDFEEILE